jgi:hypothetical protein
MSTTSGIQLSVGLRYASVFALNSNGRPNASAASAPFTGLQMEGAKAYTLTVPEPRFISHTGDDRLLAKDVLPPLEGITGEVKAAKNRYDVRALLTGVEVNTIGEAETLAFSTDKQGYEPQVGLMLYQQSLDADVSGSRFGSRRWRVSFVPKAVLIPMPPNMDENASEITFKVNAFVIKNHLWGTALTLLDDGCTEAQGLEMMMEGKPWLDCWLGDNATTVFTLSKTALSAAKISVFIDGVLTTAGVTKTVTSVTFTPAPAMNADIDILYEW